MPIYEFHCATCGADFDQLVRVEDQPACPWCESTTLERKMSAAALPIAGGKGLSQAMPINRPAGGCCGGSCGCH
jgi:putative FmdB family regulatory protein